MRVGVVALDNPHPPDYGGAWDIFYRIKALAAAGIEVDLVYFHKPLRAAAAPELAGLCRSVRGVARKTGLAAALSPLPYIVATRQACGDFETLPLIVEGVHGSQFSGRRGNTILRVHNIESRYYSELAERESNPWKKTYFYLESQKLKRYEPKAWAAADVLACISRNEAEYLKNRGYPALWLPPFAEVRLFPPRVEKNLLFYGNMHVSENRLSARRAMDTRLPEGWTLTLAGRGAQSLPQYRGAERVEHPESLGPLMARAAALVFPQSQRAGLKIKVWQALATNKAVIATPEALAGTGIAFDPEAGIFPFQSDLGDLVRALQPEYHRPRIHALVSGQNPETGLAAWKKILFGP